jgi:UDP-N-acetylglucosamine:LPS N-acetylglucosamine transferase
MNKAKIGLITSRGGHLYQMYCLKPWWSTYDRFWVTFKGVDTASLLKRERLYTGFEPDTRHVMHALRHILLAWQILRRERPTILISCGAGIAPPFFYVAKLLGIKTVFIEAYDLLSHPSMSGRMIAPIADVMLIQHPAQQKFYPNAEFKGAIL